MLTQMRNLSQNWIGRTLMGIVLGFIIISFAIWGIGDRFANFNSSELAKVGSTTLSVESYRSNYQMQLQRREQTEKRGITNEEAQRLGLDRQVLSQMLRDAILDQEATKLGLAVGDPEIAKSIEADNSFWGTNGRFDRARFEELMRDNGLTEARYVRDQRGAILRQDISSAITDGAAVPDIMSNAIHRYQAEIRDFDYFVLPQSAAGTIPNPTPADLTTYYDDRPNAFTAPEFRKLVVLSVVPADLVKPAAITDADVQKRYDEMKAARFIVPEKRTLEQLVFPDAQTASAAKAKLDGGETFDKLIADERKSPADASLGTVAKSELADPLVAAAAFVLPDGGTSAPVKGAFGTILVHVSKIFPTRQQPMIEVSAQLKDELAIVKARAEANRLRDGIEDARTAGKSLTEAAASVGLKARTLDATDSKGRNRKGEPIEGLVDGPALLKAAFTTDIGSDTEMLPTADGGDAWYEVASIDPTHRQPLSEVRTEVESAWRQGEIERRLAAKGDQLVASLNSGKTLAAVADENGKLEVMQARNVGRGGAAALPASIVGATFGVPVGKAGSTSERRIGRMIFKVAAARVPPIDPRDDQFKKLMDQVKAGYTDDILSQYLIKLQGEIGVRVNQQALQSALGGDSGS